jgi:PAS domain S-box-containing protein
MADKPDIVKILHEEEKLGEIIPIIDIAEQKKTEKAIKHSLGFEKTVSVVSSLFALNYDTDDAINTSLSEIGSFTGASRVHLFLLRDNETIMDNTHEWYNKEVSPQKDKLQNIFTEMLPWWMGKLRNGENIHIEDVSKMHSEASFEKEMLETQDVKSLLVFPLKIGEKLNGFIRLDNVFVTGKWSYEDFTILRVCSEIIGNALERRQVEGVLRESEERYRIIFERSLDGLYIHDFEGNFIDANPVALKMLGYTKEEISSLNFSSLLNEGEIPMVQEAIKELLRTGTDKGITEYYLKRADGTYIWVEIKASVIYKDRKPCGVQGIVRDITERKRMIEESEKYQWEIEQQNIKLKELDHIKSDLFTVTSHEIRAPMTSMKGYVQMLSMGSIGEITGEQKKNLEVVLRNINRLDCLIQDILDLSQLKSGTMEFVPEETNVQKLIDGVTEATQSSADLKNIEINRELEENLPSLNIDSERIKQVIINLINNAIKFSPDGSIISIKAKKNVDDILFEVQDFGCGIPKDKQAKIFETFYQVDSSMNRSFDGAGLGLSISKNIIHAHKGKIWAESEGEGTTMFFTLPISSEKQEGKEQQQN